MLLDIFFTVIHFGGFGLSGWLLYRSLKQMDQDSELVKKNQLLGNELFRRLLSLTRLKVIACLITFVAYFLLSFEYFDTWKRFLEG